MGAPYPVVNPLTLPVIDPADLEKFPLVLNGAPLALVGDVVGTASAANPAGLRVTGGNILRDYTPWTELELDDWAQGIGHADVEDGGFFSSVGVNTTQKGMRTHIAEKTVTNMMGVATANDTTRRWTTDPYMESGFVEASDGNIYAFYGHTIFKYTVDTGVWSPFLTDLTGIFSTNWKTQRDCYIIDMCEYAGYLVFVTTPFFRKSTANPVPAGNPGHILAQGTPTEVDDFTYYSLGISGSGASLQGSRSYVAPNVFAVDMADATKVFAVGGGDSVSLPLFYTDPINMGTIVVGTATDQFGLPINTQRHPYRESGVCATACQTFGGFLFIGGSMGFMYTNGASFLSDTPTPVMETPKWWDFEGADGLLMHTTFPSTYLVARLESPFNLSIKHGGGRWVTGFGGMQGQTIGETSVYMSTSRNLFLCDLAVPTLVEVMDYDGNYVRNGKGMVAYQNDLYIPTMNGVKRFTQSGQVIDVGVDALLPENPVTNAGVTNYYHHIDLTPGVDGVFSSMGSYAPSRAANTGRRVPFGVAMLKGQGWHQIINSTPVTRMTGIHYTPALRTLFIMSGAEEKFWNRTVVVGGSVTISVGMHKVPYGSSVSVIDNMVATTDDAYVTTGNVNLGWYSAGAPLLDKDWHSISIQGRCFDSTHYVRVWCRISNVPVLCGWEIDSPRDTPPLLGWRELGVVNVLNGGELFIPTSLDNCDLPLVFTRAGRYINIFLEFVGTADQSPIVEAVKLKYFVPIEDYFRFSYSTVLPKDCLTDMCGNILPQYDQALWDQALREAACSVEPVHFRDLDGKEYLVRVESESRRISKVAYVGPPNYREMEISWSLVFTQVMNPSMCEGTWVPMCLP